VVGRFLYVLVKFFQFGPLELFSACLVIGRRRAPLSTGTRFGEWGILTKVI
jgi:hypothetical protein